MHRKIRTTHTGLIAFTLALIAALLAARGIWGEQAFFFLVGLTFFPLLYHRALCPVFAAGAGAFLIPFRTYKEALTFDQLCASLAKVFVRFLEMHRSGRTKEMITQLNAV